MRRQEAAALGALAGTAATVPMTLVMLMLRRRLPRYQRYKLEPQIISDKTARRLGFGRRMNRRQRGTLAFVEHVGFGGLAGAMFGLLNPWLPAPPALTGPLFGLGVWAASYAGWVPALHILNPPRRRPKDRNLMLIAAHLVWGAVLGAIIQSSRDRQPPPYA
jgi:hypothetical protein